MTRGIISAIGGTFALVLALAVDPNPFSNASGEPSDPATFATFLAVIGGAAICTGIALFVLGLIRSPISDSDD